MESASRSLLRVAAVMLLGFSFALPGFASATTYAPGQTLTPTCSPLDPTCVVSFTIPTETVTTTLSVLGALRDSASATGTSGQILQSTGTSTLWVPTSSLGITGRGAASTSPTYT